MIGGAIYQFRAPPFGLSVAPRIFTMVLRPILAWLRLRGIKVHAYLDDWLGRASSQFCSNRQGVAITGLLQFLG